MNASIYLTFCRFYFFVIFSEKSIDYLCSQIYNKTIRNTETRNHALKVANFQQEEKQMIRLYDGRDKNFEVIGTIGEICDYMGFDRIVDGINDFCDLEQVIERDNGGMNYYHVEEVRN